jgi:cytochrome b561
MSASGDADRPARYTAVAILLHWLIAAGIAALIVIGLIMTQLSGRLPQMEVFKLYQLHKSIGITVLLLAVLRVLWRFTHRPPPLPHGMPAVEKGAAHGLHWLLYLFMIGLPLTGWAVVSSSPFNLPTVLYSLVPWPDLPILPGLPDKAAVSHALAWVHAYGAWVLIALLAAHIGAALRHHFIRRDPILGRMLPGLRGPGARGAPRARRTVS